MYADRYFPARFFPNRYWPPGASGPGPSGGPTDTFAKGTGAALAAVPLPESSPPPADVPSASYFKSTRKKIAWPI